MSLKFYNHYKNAKEIKELVNEKIKEISLKCFLIYYSYEFDSLSVEYLCQKFNLTENKIRKIVNNVSIYKYNNI